MLSSCRITAPLLLLLMMMMMTMIMMSALTQAQSGDEEIAPRTSCTSHITTGTSTLTCNVVTDDNDSEDDEDMEDDSIEEIKACYTDLNWKVKCLNSSGNTISFTNVSPVINLTVTLGLKSGRNMTKTINLLKIVKPRSPHVWNVTFQPYQAVIHVRTPYYKDYLTEEKQLFQLLIWSTTHRMIQNISLVDKIVMKIDEAHLKKNTMYHVKVRAIPQKYLQGTWSEWSKPYNFSTPAGTSHSISYAGKIPITNLWETYPLIVCFVLILVVTSSVILSWRNKIFTYMWPTIPHPKDTLVQSCNPNTGLLLNVKPDVFSVLKVYSMPEMDDKSEPLVPAEKDQSCFPCSSQSSDCSGSGNSVSTEDLALSGLLSRSSFEEEDSHQSTAHLPVEPPGMLQPVCDSEEKRSVFGAGKPEEAYVTMSSFYQINKSVQKE